MVLDINRWVIHEIFHEGSRKYYNTECSICGEVVERVRSDGLKRKQCSCSRKPAGKPLYEGDKFGKLTVIGRAGSNGKNALYSVKCECGTIKEIQGSQLRSGSTNSCGCTLENKRGGKRESHGKTGTKEYKIWASIVNRTSFPHESTRKWYFDKGIKMSEDWRSSFTTFLEDMGECPEGYSIDRIDPSKDYCKENCRWATNALQSINKGISGNNTSGRTGVSYNKRMDRWTAYIYVDHSRIHLGTFMTFEAASVAREQAEIKYWSHIKE